MTGRCATCRWFVPWKDADLDYWSDLPDGWGICTLITADVDNDPEANPNVKALLQQQWSEHSDMAVAPDFGCVEHEHRGDA
jgi:hypothetical protein